jgi:hypothetical protein
MRRPQAAAVRITNTRPFRKPACYCETRAKSFAIMETTTRKNKPLVRKAGARQRLVLGDRQVTFTWMVWYPVAPLGSVWCFTAVWVWPVLSVARTWSTCCPGVVSQT